MGEAVDTADQPGLTEDQLAHIKVLRRILRFLATDERLAPMQGRIKVFGSSASGKDCPGDIDAYIDFSDSTDSYQHPSVIPGANLLLAVARQFYGTFDPFVRVGKILYARSDDANGWVTARQVREIRKAGEAGRPPQDVLDEIRSRPQERGGMPRPKVDAEEPPSPRGP